MGEGAFVQKSTQLPALVRQSCSAVKPVMMMMVKVFILSEYFKFDCSPSSQSLDGEEVVEALWVVCILLTRQNILTIGG